MKLVWLLLTLIAFTAHAQYADGIAAAVNEDVVLFSDIKKRSDPVLAEEQKKFTGSPEAWLEKKQEIRKKTIEKLIDERLIIQAFWKKGYSVPGNIVEARLKDVVENQFGGNWNRFLEQLQNNGILLEDYRTELREQIIRQYMMQSQVSVVVRNKFQLPAFDGQTPEQKEAYLKARDKRRAEWMAELRADAFVKEF